MGIIHRHYSQRGSADHPGATTVTQHARFNPCRALPYFYTLPYLRARNHLFSSAPSTLYLHREADSYRSANQSPSLWSTSCWSTTRNTMFLVAGLTAAKDASEAFESKLRRRKDTAKGVVGRWPTSGCRVETDYHRAKMQATTRRKLAEGRQSRGVSRGEPSLRDYIFSSCSICLRLAVVNLD